MDKLHTVNIYSLTNSFLYWLFISWRFEQIIFFNTLSLYLLTRQLSTANLSYFKQINGENSSVTNYQLFPVNQNYQRSYEAEREIYFRGMSIYLLSIETFFQYDAVSAEDYKEKLQFNIISPDFFP